MAQSIGSIRASRRAGQQVRVRSQLKGARATRQLIKQIGPEAKAEMNRELAAIAPVLVAAIKADTPVLKRPRKGRIVGELRAAILSKLLQASMRLRVGLITKEANYRLFYGKFVERGRKAGTKSRGGPVAPHPFVYKKRPEIRNALNARLNRFWDNTLAAAAAGVGDD